MKNTVLYYFFSRIDRLTGKLSQALAYVAAGCVFFLMLLITLHVLLRYFFDLPVPGAVEIIEFTMIFVVFLGFGQIAYKGANVAVEVLMMRFPLKIQWIAAIAANLLGILITTLLVWQSWLRTRLLYESNQISGVLHIPYYPFCIILVIGYSVFIFALLVETLTLIMGEKSK